MSSKLFSELAKGTYNGATAYTVGDFVDYNGSSYACIANTTGNLPTNATYWALLASKGATGATGATGSTGATGAKGLNWRGAWVAGTYQIDDAVENNGSSWIATAITTEEPTGTPTDWDVLAEKGATGDTTPNASTTVAGKVEQATEAQVLAETETGETGAPLFISPVNIQAAVEAFAPAPTIDKSSILQNITIPCNQSAAESVRMSGSDDANSYAYARASNLLVLMTDGVMPQQRNVQTDYASSEILSVVINGDYVYVLLTASSICKIFRYSKANLASSPTELTMSGQSFASTSTNIKLAIDGTTFYLSGKAGNSASLNVISKYTLSGTTLTYDSDVTCGSTSNDFSAGMAVISGNIYGLNNVDEIITKFNSSGTETDDSDAVFSQPSLTFRDLFNWKGSLFVCQPVRPSTTAGVGASVVFYRVYVS